MDHSLKLHLSQIRIWKRIAMGMTKVISLKGWTIVPQDRNPQPWFDQVILWWPKYWVGLQFHETEWELWRLPGNLECRGHFLSGSFGSIVIMWDIVTWLDENLNHKYMSIWWIYLSGSMIIVSNIYALICVKNDLICIYMDMHWLCI